MHIQKLQRIENGVFKKIGPQEEALRGDTGTSSMKTRVREGQWKFLRYIIEGKNYLLRRIAEEIMENKKNRWMKDLVNELKKVGIKSGSMMNVTNEGIRERMREWDTREWKQGMNEKSSLKICRNGEKK